MILTCLTPDYVVQAADRRLTRPDGQLYDSDTNKAVFYCGRVAVAYTGPAEIGGHKTDEWIGLCMKDSDDAEAAMNELARRSTTHLARMGPPRHFAAVAAGWATLRGGPTLMPYVCIASNFLSDSGRWEMEVSETVAVRTWFLGDGASHLLFVAGQELAEPERVELDRLIRRAVERGCAKPHVLTRLLGETIRGVADGADDRSRRVGKALIVQSLAKVALSVVGGPSIVTPLHDHCHSLLYVSEEGRTDRFQGSVIACGGALLTGWGGGTIPPGGKGRIRTEMEAGAREHPIILSSNESRYQARCPFCDMEENSSSPAGSGTLVQGELPLSEPEQWVYCGGNVGHLLLVQRTTRLVAEIGEYRLALACRSWLGAYLSLGLSQALDEWVRELRESLDALSTAGQLAGLLRGEGPLAGELIGETTDRLSGLEAGLSEAWAHGADLARSVALASSSGDQGWSGPLGLTLSEYLAAYLSEGFSERLAAHLQQLESLSTDLEELLVGFRAHHPSGPDQDHELDREIALLGQHVARLSASTRRLSELLQRVHANPPQ